jgi:CDP-glycerol glycerophosphotransferase
MQLSDIFYGALSAVLGKLVPKNPRLYAFTGRVYGGNTAPLFEAAKARGIDAVWLTKRETVLKQGRPGVVSSRSLYGVWLGARACAVVLTHSLGDLGPVLLTSRRTRVINVYHGMPIKKISRADPAFMTRAYARRNLREMARYECMIATSRAMARLFSETFGLPLERVYVTGQPRTDVLFGPGVSPVHARYTPALPAHTKRILYCPTWRDGIDTRLFPFDDLDFDSLEQALETLDAVMYVRTHPNDAARLKQRRGRIVPMQGDVVEEVTDVLPQFDVLITDYSSVYYDFLLLDRPTIFLPYDLDAYTRSPGFFIPFEQIVSGPAPQTLAAFLAALREAIVQPDAHAKRRRQVIELVHEHVDGGATERVLSRIIKSA